MLRSRKIITLTPEQTVSAGKNFARDLTDGSIVLLDGELGTGKTTFTRGVVSSLLGSEWADRVSSPTFTMVHQYEGRRRIIHLDLYRLDSSDASQDGEIMSLISDESILLVEWSSKRKQIFDKCDWVVNFKHSGGDRREICIQKK